MEITVEMIAPCGLNCATCPNHLRKKSPCSGCLTENIGKRAICVMKHCAEHEKSGISRCAECRRLPCARMRSFARRYPENGAVDIMRINADIRELGLEEYVRRI